MRRHFDRSENVSRLKQWWERRTRESSEFDDCNLQAPNSDLVINYILLNVVYLILQENLVHEFENHIVKNCLF